MNNSLRSSVNSQQFGAFLSTDYTAGSRPKTEDKSKKNKSSVNKRLDHSIQSIDHINYGLWTINYGLTEKLNCLQNER